MRAVTKLINNDFALKKTVEKNRMQGALQPQKDSRQTSGRKNENEEKKESTQTKKRYSHKK